MSLCLPRMFSEFSLKCLYSTMCAKNCQIYGVHILGKCIESRRFYSCSASLEACPQVPVITSYRQKEITYFPRQRSFKNLFPPLAERGGENYDLLYKIPSEKNKMTWNILYDLQFFQM